MDWRSRLTTYLAGKLPSAERVEIVRVRHMPAGASNETVGLDAEVECDGRSFIVPLVFRPQRRGGILAPYDVSRQFRVMRALQATPVPVPPTLWYEPDESVFGAPFFFMRRIEGETLPLFWYGSRSPRLYSIAEALAEVHRVDWQRRRLDFLLDGAAPASPVEAELAAWRTRHERAGLAGHGLSDELYAYLVRNEPADARLAMLHGDPNPGNYLVQGDDVAAVLDWELAAIGDPRSDLGFYAALLTIFTGARPERGHTVLSAAYTEVTGETLANLDYYEAVGLYKMAVVMAGWMGSVSMGYGLEAITSRLSELLGPRWAA